MCAKIVSSFLSVQIISQFRCKWLRQNVKKKIAHISMTTRDSYQSAFDWEISVCSFGRINYIESGQVLSYFVCVTNNSFTLWSKSSQVKQPQQQQQQQRTIQSLSCLDNFMVFNDLDTLECDSPSEEYAKRFSDLHIKCCWWSVEFWFFCNKFLRKTTMRMIFSFFLLCIARDTRE